MYHFNDAAQEAAWAKQDEAEAYYERLWPQVETELTLEAIRCFATGEMLTHYSATKDAEAYEHADSAFIDFIDNQRLSRVRDVMQALHAASEGKPEARLQAMALIAAFAKDRADTYCEEVTRVRMQRQGDDE